MGQYFRAVALNSKERNYPNKDKVASFITPIDYGQCSKLMEFAYIDNRFMNAFEELINKEHGDWAGMPVILAGDYADNEPCKVDNKEVNIYKLTKLFEEKKDRGVKNGKHYHCIINEEHYRYIINEDKKQFIDTAKIEDSNIHPLALLLADGNSRGGGDYKGFNEDRVGSWARNVVVVSDNQPNETYEEISIYFFGDY